MNANAPINPNAVGATLESTAKNGSVTNYGSIARQFNLPSLDGAWSAHPLSQIFEVLDQQDAAASRPFRTSVVVTVDTNRPGGGFFTALERLKGIADPGTPAGRDAVWAAELQAAHAHPWPQAFR
jgi:hypothetical protein